jgi:CxxC-x17-CxxC domain-containing protein
MGFNDNNNKQFGRRNFDNRNFGGDRQMFKAVCSACGKDCEVPFKPSGNKPVYCSDCFEKTNERSGPRRFNDRSDRNDRPQQNNEQLNVINNKLDKILALLNPSVSVSQPKPQETKKEELKEEVKEIKTPKKTRVASKSKKTE